MTITSSVPKCPQSNLIEFRYKATFKWNPKQGLTNIKFDFDHNLLKYMERDEIVERIKTLVSDYIAVNALFVRGNVVESKNTVAVGKTIGKDKHCFIRSFEGNLYAVKSGSHRSPSGTFPVRGHFRKYKDGKIIWIDQFTKGTEKD